MVFGNRKKNGCQSLVVKYSLGTECLDGYRSPGEVTDHQGYVIPHHPGTIDDKLLRAVVQDSESVVQ